jgi:DNA-binding MarR family transcriptional regulator
MLSQISIQQITGLVDKLEKRGFIERQPDRKDRRVKMIAVTPAGAKFRAQMLDRLSEPPASVVSLDPGTEEGMPSDF